MLWCYLKGSCSSSKPLGAQHCSEYNSVFLLLQRLRPLLNSNAQQTFTGPDLPGNSRATVYHPAHLIPKEKPQPAPQGMEGLLQLGSGGCSPSWQRRRGSRRRRATLHPVRKQWPHCTQSGSSERDYLCSVCLLLSIQSEGLSASANLT